MVLTEERKLAIIEAEVCDFLQIQPAEIKTKSRERHLAEARFCIFYNAKKFTRLSLRKIGLPYQRDHASVMYGCQMMEELIDYNGWGRKCDHIRKRIEDRIKNHKKIDEIEDFAIHSGNFLIHNT